MGSERSDSQVLLQEGIMGKKIVDFRQIRAEQGMNWRMQNAINAEKTRIRAAITNGDIDYEEGARKALAFNPPLTQFAQELRLAGVCAAAPLTSIEKARRAEAACPAH